MKYYVYDIELFPDIFCVGFKSFPDGGRYFTYEISSRRDEREQLLKFLKKRITLIGFNNTGFDYPVLHFLINNPEIDVTSLWKMVQKKIFQEDFFLWKNQITIPQIDLYKIWHYNNTARATSLKYLQFSMRWEKMQDLPYDPHEPVTEYNFDVLIDYMKNDVDSTFEFALRSRDKIRFRYHMSKKLGKNVMNYSDVAIGETLNMQVYSEKSGLSPREFRKKRTRRYSIPLDSVIPEYISFKTKRMQDFLRELKKTSISPKHPFKYVHRFGNVDVTMGKGGLHSVDESRHVERKEGWILKEMDVGSMYPRGIVVDKVYPKHLGPSWYESIRQSYDYRAEVLKPKLKTLKKGTKEYEEVSNESDAYKLAMNGGGFGKTGSEYSWQYDMAVMYKITIGGELKLMMLLEALEIRNFEIVSVNTDGVVVHYPEEREKDLQKISDWWQKETKFVLEDTYYSSIVFANVNGYMAFVTDHEGNFQYLKCKGVFTIDNDYHQDSSQRIVAIALKEYYQNGVPVKEVIRNIGYEFVNSKGEKEKTSIYDYCIARKSTYKSEYHIHNEYGDKHLKDKVIRYYIANTTDKLIKKYVKGKAVGKTQALNKGYHIQMFMDYEEKEDYNIDFNYYENECRKITEPIRLGTNRMNNESVQLTLL